MLTILQIVTILVNEFGPLTDPEKEDDKEELLVELVCLVKLDLGYGLDDELLDLARAELLDLREPPVEREFQDGDPVVEGSVVY